RAAPGGADDRDRHPRRRRRRPLRAGREDPRRPGRVGRGRRRRRRRGGLPAVIAANVQNALEQLWSHKLRSLLTVLGIVIAVTSTITGVGVIQGFRGYVAEFLQGRGRNGMGVWPQRPPGEAGKRLGRVELDERDIEALERGCPALGRVSPLVRRETAKFRVGREEVTA